MAAIEFTDGCTFSRDADGHIGIVWDNGHAVTAVRGAAVDYVDPKFHMAVTRAGNALTYAPLPDLKRLIDGGITPILAMVVVGMRKVCASFEGVTLNIAETTLVDDQAERGVLSEADWQRIAANVAAFRALLDLGPTVLGMNGLSLMLKGHNYIDTDSMWSRLEAALDVETLVAPLGIMDHSGTLYHDALHPFAAEWKVSLAADVQSPIVGHVNGVLLKRLPGVPAGTTIVFVTLAAIGEIKLIRPQTARAMRILEKALTRLRNEIRNAPLDWCAVFQRASTAENLSKVSALEPLCAFIYGACSALFDRKMSIMKSASFKNTSGRHTAMTSIGREWAEALETIPMDASAVAKIFRDLVAKVDSSSAAQSEDEDDDEDDEEDE
jgi:hypothetical protein